MGVLSPVCWNAAVYEWSMKEGRKTMMLDALSAEAMRIHNGSNHHLLKLALICSLLAAGSRRWLFSVSSTQIKDEGPSLYRTTPFCNGKHTRELQLHATDAPNIFVLRSIQWNTESLFSRKLINVPRRTPSRLGLSFAPYGLYSCHPKTELPTPAKTIACISCPSLSINCSTVGQ